MIDEIDALMEQVTTGCEMAECAVVDKLAMLSYLTQVHELFRGEIPCIKQPKRVTIHSFPFSLQRATASYRVFFYIHPRVFFLNIFKTA